MNEWKHQRLLSNSLHLSMTPLCTAFTLFPSSVLCCSQKQQQPQAYDGSVISCDAVIECSAAASTIIAPPTIKSTHILYYSRIVPNRPKNFLLTCYVKTATNLSTTFFVNTRRTHLSASPNAITETLQVTTTKEENTRRDKGKER